jgi:uncharacterized glyoxalase superfamily protein PhnB
MVLEGEQALRFYQQAFGAKVVYRLQGDPNAGVVARLSVEGAEFWLSGGQPHEPNAECLGGGSVRMILTVIDLRQFSRGRSRLARLKFSR